MSLTMPDPPFTADAVAREAAWLQTSGDGLPALLASDGGPFEVVQAYWPGSKFRARATGVYVDHGDWSDPKVANVRLRPQYVFTVKVYWPIKATAAPIAETEQQNLDIALELLRQRIDGPEIDKSHGGRFLSVGQVPRGAALRFRKEDPEVSLQRDPTLRASATYYADDLEFNG